MVEMENIRTTSVIVRRCRQRGRRRVDKRRGVARHDLLLQIAGAKAETKASLDEVTATAQKAADHCRSVGVALTSLYRPVRPGAPFSIGRTKWRLAMASTASPASAGEPLRRRMKSCKRCWTSACDMPLGSGDRVSVLCNSLGAHTARGTALHQLPLHRQGIDGEECDNCRSARRRYATSMEMAGFRHVCSSTPVGSSAHGALRLPI